MLLVFSTHLSATWTGNHRNASVIFSYIRISPAPSALKELHTLISIRFMRSWNNNSMCVCMSAQTCVHVCVYIGVWMCAYMSLHMWMCVCVCWYLHKKCSGVYMALHELKAAQFAGPLSTGARHSKSLKRRSLSSWTVSPTRSPPPPN